MKRKKKEKTQASEGKKTQNLEGDPNKQHIFIALLLNSLKSVVSDSWYAIYTEVHKYENNHKTT